MKLYLRYILKGIIRFVLRLGHLCPLKRNMVVFESFEGKQQSCNPYYIYKYLRAIYPQGYYVWCLNQKQGAEPCYARGSARYIWALLRTSVYVTNDSLPDYIPFRKKQYVINTWHGGGAYKKCGIATRVDWYGLRGLKRSAMQTSCFISSSVAFTKYISKSFMLDPNRFLPVGMPRNDLFFAPNEVVIANDRVRKNYGILDDTFVILYAPTFRNTPQDPRFEFNLNLEQIVRTVRSKFNCKTICFVFRGHHTFKNFLNRNLEFPEIVIDASSYPQMQELMCASDMMISDYSSSIWDYSFLYRPCLLYVPDLIQYEAERSFYVPIKDWGFPLASNNEELIACISSWNDQDFRQAMEMHHSSLGSYENGTATKQIAELIIRKMTDNDIDNHPLLQC